MVIDYAFWLLAVAGLLLLVFICLSVIERLCALIVGVVWGNVVGCFWCLGVCFLFGAGFVLGFLGCCLLVCGCFVVIIASCLLYLLVGL